MRGDCGECIPCKDKPKFGGPGVRKQGCEMRRCVMLGADGEKHCQASAAPPSAPVAAPRAAARESREVGGVDPLSRMGPWARVHSRVCAPTSPYAASGRLVVERCVPVSRLRPRPPPPPSDFLSGDVAVGQPLQLWLDGMWWDVAVVEVEVEALMAKGSTRSSDGTNGGGGDGGGGDGAGSGTGVDAEGGEGGAGGGAAAATTAKRGIRYVVQSPLHSDVQARVSSQELRPCWRWSGAGWRIEELPAGIAAGAAKGAAAGAAKGADGVDAALSTAITAAGVPTLSSSDDRSVLLAGMQSVCLKGLSPDEVSSPRLSHAARSERLPMPHTYGTALHSRAHRPMHAPPTV